MRIAFEKISIKAVKRWTDASGKKHQETKKFWQTINPWNVNEDGTQKTREQITAELKEQREAWLKQPVNQQPLGSQE